MGPETMLIGDIANLPEHAVFVFESIASLDLVRVVAFLLLPLFVALVVNHFVAVLVWIELVLVLVVVLYSRWKQGSRLARH